MMPTCRDVTRKATALDEGALPWLERMALQVHLLMCAHCRRYVAQLRLVRRQAATLPRDAAPGELQAHVRDWFKHRTP
ncbi:MAG: zf-HC2 domain-containing protein [Vicinamibacterales bacterium]|nr:zf-HC2 domain-containing protein [Vicinamibacterales bacterium]